MSIADFKKHVASSTKRTKEYKQYLAVMKTEDMEWYVASKTVMEYLHKDDKLTAKDYTEINGLKKWYEALESEA